MRNRRDSKEVVSMIGRKSIEKLTDVALVVLGETLKDRLVRAILVGVASSFGHFAATVDPTITSTPLPHTESSQKQNAP